MTNHQLTDFGGDDDSTDTDTDSEADSGRTSAREQPARPTSGTQPSLDEPVDSDYEYDLNPDHPKSCPWCLATPGAFEELDNGNTICTNCGGSVPIGVEWYENGEKQGTVRWAARVHW